MIIPKWRFQVKGAGKHKDDIAGEAVAWASPYIEISACSRQQSALLAFSHPAYYVFHREVQHA